MSRGCEDSSGPLFVAADNQALTRAGLRALLAETVPAARVVEAGSKAELVAVLEKHDVAAVCLDYTLFDFRGIEDFLILRGRFDRVVWVLFSAELSERFLRGISAETSVGIVLKDSPGEEIVEALRRAARGERYICAAVAGLLAESRREEPRVHLTPAETEILRALALGKTVKEIAVERFSSVHTVTTHKKNLFRKLGVNSSYEATRYALRAGWVEIAEYYI